jgi:HAD superfamily hydrolase (TIGR01509 family)
VNAPDFLPEAFLLDLDGVLVHSEGTHLEAYERAFAVHGLTLDDDARRRVREGRSREDVLAGAGVPPALGDEVGEAKEAAFGELLAEGALVPARGAEEFLQALRRGDVPVGLVSNSASAVPCLQAVGLAWAFDVVVDGTMVEAPKPAPDPWLLAATRLGVDPSRCVAVEDSPAGARAARRAGIFVVGVGPRLREEEVDLLVSDLASLPLESWLTEESSAPAEPEAVRSPPSTPGADDAGPPSP